MNEPTNRITFTALRVSQGFDLIDSLTGEDIEYLYEDIAERKASIKNDEAFLALMMKDKFGTKAQAAYMEKGEDTGTVRLEFGEGHELVAKRKKTVKWDQAKLKELWDHILAAKEDPAVYMKKKVETTITIAENTYKDWPDNIKSAFEPARTVESGDLALTVERKAKQ